MTANISVPTDGITSKEYWESYYGNSKTDVTAIVRLGDVYKKYWSVCVNTQIRNVVEIGAYPGRYLAYLFHAFDLKPTAVDFQSDLTRIEENLKAVGCNDYELVNEDFLTWNPKQVYDLVISLGFIEHFVEFQAVIDKHFRLLSAGGKVFIVIPNKRSLRRAYGLLADRENLRAHNLKAMSLDVFRRSAEKHKLEIEVLEYFGPFQFALHGNSPNRFRLAIYHAFRFVFKTMGLNRIVERYPSKFWSSSIVFIARKKLK